MEILRIVLLLLLALVAYQDIKYRFVHALLIIGVAVVSIIMFYLLDFNINNLIKPLLFITLNILGLFLYFSIKNKTFINPINKVLGIGDVLFLFAVIPLFSFRNYIIFYILGLLFSVFSDLVIFRKNRVKHTVPLAAYLSIFLILISIYDYLTQFDFLLIDNYAKT